MSMATITIIMIRPRDINTNIPLVMGMEDSTMEDTAEVTMVMRTGLMAMGTQQIRLETEEMFGDTRTVEEVGGR